MSEWYTLGEEGTLGGGGYRVLSLAELGDALAPDAASPDGGGAVSAQADALAALSALARGRGGGGDPAAAAGATATACAALARLQAHVRGGGADALLCDLTPLLCGVLAALPRRRPRASARGAAAAADGERLHLASLRLMSALWAAVAADAAAAPLLAPAQLAAAALAVCAGRPAVFEPAGAGAEEEELAFNGAACGAAGAAGAAEGAAGCCPLCGSARAGDGDGGALRALWAAFAHACLAELLDGPTPALASASPLEPPPTVLRAVLAAAAQLLLPLPPPPPPPLPSTAAAACRCAAACAAARAHAAVLGDAAGAAPYPWLAPLLLRGASRAPVLAAWLAGTPPALAALVPLREALQRACDGERGGGGGGSDERRVVAAQLAAAERLLRATAPGAAALAAAAATLTPPRG